MTTDPKFSMWSLYMTKVRDYMQHFSVLSKHFWTKFGVAAKCQTKVKLFRQDFSIYPITKYLIHEKRVCTPLVPAVPPPPKKTSNYTAGPALLFTFMMYVISFFSISLINEPS